MPATIPKAKSSRLRRVSIHTAAGAVLRLRVGEDGGAREIKALLRAVLRMAHAPESAEAEALSTCTDAISNWHDHNRDGDLDYHLRAGNGCIEQVYEYPCPERFDTSPPLAPPCEEHGRGINLMRWRCESSGGEMDYYFGGGRVVLRMILRYEKAPLRANPERR